MMKKILILMLGLVVGILGGCGDEKSDDVLKIGAILPLSGDLAAVGEKLQTGFEMAKADFLEENSGMQIEINYQDGEFDPKKAVTAVHFLLGTQNPGVILGPFGPDQSLAVAPVVKNQAPEMPVVAMSMCNPSMEKEENLFCVFPGSSRQADVVIDEFLRRDVKNVAFVAMISEPTTELLKRFRERMEDRMGLVMEVLADETDFRTVVTRVKESDPDGIFYMTLPPFPFAQRLHEQGLGDVLTFTWMDWDEEELAKGREVFEGQLSLGAPGVPLWFAERFAEEGRKETADMYHQIAYDAATAVFLAMKEGGDVTANLKKIKEEKTALTGFWFSDDRRADDVELDLKVIRDGKFVPFEN